MPKAPTEDEKPSTAKEKARANLKVFMAERHMTAPTLANRTGISLGTLQKLINGQRRLQLDQIDRLAKQLGRDPGDFFADAPPPPKELPPIAFELSIVGDRIPIELVNKALEAINALNEEYGRGAKMTVDEILPGRIHVATDASELLSTKAETRPRQPHVQQKQPRQPSPRDASKPSRRR